MTTSLIVARARIAGGIDLSREAPDHLRIDAGDELLVKVPFRFDEVDRRREDYVVRLTTRLDGEPETTEVFEGRDVAALTDDRRGVVSISHAILNAGTHTLHYRVDLRLSLSDWGGGGETVQETECAGTVQVDVR